MHTERVTTALNQLIEAPNFAGLVNEITRIVETWDTQPMAYGGNLAPLNALVDVGLQNRVAFEKLIVLAEERRKLHPDVRRTDYQRQLMRSRRARMAKALELHELRFGKLQGPARVREEQSILRRWSEAKRRFLAMQGEMSWHERNAATQEFWRQLDNQLDANLREATKLRLVS